METKTLYQRLFEAKKEIGKISKDSTNPFYKSKYFDINSLLEHVEPVLFKHGLIVMQPIIDNKVCTMILSIDNDNQTIDSSIQLPEMDDPQKLGSAITYYRRYTLQSLLALQAEDDDGNKAIPAKTQSKQPEKQWLNPGTDKWKEAIKWLSTGGKMETIEKNYRLSKENRELLLTNAI